MYNIFARSLFYQFCYLLFKSLTHWSFWALSRSESIGSGSGSGSGRSGKSGSGGSSASDEGNLWPLDILSASITISDLLSIRVLKKSIAQLLNNKAGWTAVNRSQQAREQKHSGLTNGRTNQRTNERTNELQAPSKTLPAPSETLSALLQPLQKLFRSTVGLPSSLGVSSSSLGGPLDPPCFLVGSYHFFKDYPLGLSILTNFGKIERTYHLPFQDCIKMPCGKGKVSPTKIFTCMTFSFFP